MEPQAAAFRTDLSGIMQSSMSACAVTVQKYSGRQKRKRKQVNRKDGRKGMFKKVCRSETRLLRMTHKTFLNSPLLRYDWILLHGLKRNDRLNSCINLIIVYYAFIHIDFNLV